LFITKLRDIPASQNLALSQQACKINQSYLYFERFCLSFKIWTAVHAKLDIYRRNLTFCAISDSMVVHGHAKTTIFIVPGLSLLGINSEFLQRIVSTCERGSQLCILLSYRHWGYKCFLFTFGKIHVIYYLTLQRGVF